ncbi:hypothetical protein Ga0100231_007450 [Opitutaceae bacterium TAV4]|nr:hypothetical protein Ga0100231_007450 [Opitutaceae bacterium TAV4]RRK00549.1 hypothetical protein Ga0100230_022125 [Opitutaceae bacterium TAV3]
MITHLEDLVHNIPLWLLLISASVLCLLLAALLRQRTLVLSDKETGKLEISKHAIHRLLEACCVQVNGIAWARAEVTHSDGKFHTQLRLKVRPDAKLDAIQGYLEQEIAEIYRQNLGIADIGRTEIKVIGVVIPKKDF